MRIQLPKPMHGWRAFFGEVGVIVLGVLLALGAQQAVEEMRIRDEVETFRETIDREIALNLYTYDVRVRQHGCIVNDLGRVERWLGQARSGQAVSGLETSGPYVLSPYRSAWNNRNAAVFQHLPAALRTKYAEFYDELDNNARLITVEGEAWNPLNPYAEPGPLPLRDRRTIRAIIKQAAYLDATLVDNVEVSRGIARDLGVDMARPDGMPAELDVVLARCDPAVADS